MDRAEIRQEVEEVLARYPLLRAELNGHDIKIVGTFTISEGGQESDRFLVEIVLDADYPASLPMVWETGGRIPRTLDRHVYPHSGQACTLLPLQRWELWPSGASLLNYVDGPMRNYFISQALVENGDPWPFGEWGHGLEGVDQYYLGLLNIPAAAAIVPMLTAIADEDWKGHRDCPCGSRKRTRHCHGEHLRAIRMRMGTDHAKVAAKIYVNICKLCE